MKRLILFILFLTPAFAFCQSADTPVEASLFLPAHVVKGLTADQKLTIHYVLEGPEEKWETSKIMAKKVKDNVYSFSLKQGMYFRLVFVIGDYSYNMICIDNRSGEAMDKYTFNVLLEKRKFNPDELKFIAPCIARDDE
ncbi:MAG: hypothetical protein GXC78_11490 [Chitinophagaceae bacterium]|nr:hypothetical protein [Chitinophagaceae bacterium]